MQKFNINACFSLQTIATSNMGSKPNIGMQTQRIDFKLQQFDSTGQ